MDRFYSIFGFLICLLALGLPTKSSAAVPQYASFQSLRQSNVIIQYGNIEKKYYYNCSLSSFSCTKSTNTPTINFPLKAKTGQKLLVSSDASKAILVETKKNGAGNYNATVYKNISGKVVKVGTIATPYLPYSSLWSSDYNKVALYSKDATLPANNIRIFIFDTDKLTSFGETTIETKYAYSYTLSPRGDTIAFYDPPRDSNNKTRSFNFIDINSGKTYKINEPLDYWDLVSEQPRTFQFSTDGKTLFFVDDKDDPMTLYTVDIDNTRQTGEMTAVRFFPNSKEHITDFAFIDANTLVYISNTPDAPYEWDLRLYDMTKNTTSVITTNVVYTSRILKEGKYLLVNKIVNNTAVPYVYNTQTKAGKYFTQLKPSTTALPGTRSIVDINGMKGVLVQPKGGITADTPLFIWLHGGPYRQTSYGYHPYGSYGVYDWILDEMVKKGVAVLKLDYRGSLGYGRIYASSIKNEVGKGDVADVVQAATKIRTDYPALQKVFLVGNSYGGYLTLKSLVERPETFSGGFSINGVTDWAELLIPLRTSIFNTHFNGLPDDSNKWLYDQASILQKINNLPNNLPVVIAQGSSDNTINPSQATLLYNALKNTGKDTAIVRYAGQGHTFSAVKPLTDICKRLLYMAGKSSTNACVFK